MIFIKDEPRVYLRIIVSHISTYNKTKMVVDRLFKIENKIKFGTLLQFDGLKIK